MTRTGNKVRWLARPARLLAAFGLAAALGSAGYGMAQAGGTAAVRSSLRTPAKAVEVQVIGIDLSSQTGYSKTATVFFDVNSDVNAMLCGTTGFPGGPDPGKVQLEP